MKYAKKILLGILISSSSLLKLLNRIHNATNKSIYAKLEISELNELRNLLKPQNFSRNSLARLGSNNDGGYVIFTDEYVKQELLSLGVGDNITFDIELGKRMLHTYFFDDSVSALPALVSNSSFFQKRISTMTSPKHYSLSDCIELIPKTSEIFLKIDIEGSEWDIFDKVKSKELLRFRQIVGEFHGFHEIYNFDFYQKVMRVLKKLNNTHSLIHLHANNWGQYRIINGVPVPDVLELSFLRKDIFYENMINKDLPPPFFSNFLDFESLDQPNNPLAPEIRLSFFEPT